MPDNKDPADITVNITLSLEEYAHLVAGAQEGARHLNPFNAFRVLTAVAVAKENMVYIPDGLDID